LVLIVREAGFADAIVQQFGISIDPKMAPDSNERQTESSIGFSFSTHLETQTTISWRATSVITPTNRIGHGGL
jgi:hypothetical protein